VLSPGISAAGYRPDHGQPRQEGHPLGTLTGLWAVKPAAEGFTGPLDILDHKGYYDASRIAAGLGESFVEKFTHLTRGLFPLRELLAQPVQ
jgi:2-methylcitrate dehydratase PrpD